MNYQKTYTVTTYNLSSRHSVSFFLILECFIFLSVSRIFFHSSESSLSQSSSKFSSIFAMFSFWNELNSIFEHHLLINFELSYEIRDRSAFFTSKPFIHSQWVDSRCLIKFVVVSYTKMSRPSAISRFLKFTNWKLTWYPTPFVSPEECAIEIYKFNLLNE